jgi:hypothetical protein
VDTYESSISFVWENISYVLLRLGSFEGDKGVRKGGEMSYCWSTEIGKE